MPHYLVLGKFTEQGVKAIKQAPARMAHARETVESMGGKMKEVYYAMGEYDFVGMFEFPDDETMLSFSMRVAREGNIRFTTMRIFPREEVVKLIEALP